MHAGSRKERVYLSGGMEHARNHGSGWRAEIEQWLRSSLGHDVFNPVRESDRFLKRHLPKGDFRSLKSSNPPKFRKLLSRIVDLDSREVVKKSTYVICYWDRSANRGAGTKGEVTLARYFRKPVYVVTRMQTDNIPAWVLGCTTKMFPSFRALKNFLQRRFHRISKGGL